MLIYQVKLNDGNSAPVLVMFQELKTKYGPEVEDTYEEEKVSR